VVRKREVAACVEAPRVGLAGRAPADTQRARAGLGEAPEIVRIGTGQLSEDGVEFVQCRLRRCARRRAASVRLRAQHRQQRALIARPQMRQLLGRLRVKRHRRHGARGQREIFVRNGRRGAVLAEMGAQRAVVIEERRRTGEFAQIMTLERRPEIAQRRAEARPHALGLGRIAGRERRKPHQHIGETRGAQPAGAAQRVRDAHQCSRATGVLLERQQRFGERQLRGAYGAAARVGQCVEGNGSCGSKSHELATESRRAAAWRCAQTERLTREPATEQ